MTKTTALHATHLRLGAKMTEFGGYEMPLAYSEGTIAEHLAVRTGAGVFDVSHLGSVEVSGPEAFARLQAVFTNDLARISAGRAQYTHLLDENGSVLDDIIVWWLEDTRFHVMPNAANTENVLANVGGDDITDSRTILAVQGPAARAYVADLISTAELPSKNRIIHGSYQGAPVIVSGTGYTGSDGVELSLPNEVAEECFLALIEAGVKPCGLGSRDTLRLEAGLPLHGHELGNGLTPLNARLDWVVKFDKGEFPGKVALLQQKIDGVSPLITGLTTGTRAPLRTGERIYSNQVEVGWVSSGGYSPLRKQGIGLGFLKADSPEPIYLERNGSMLAIERCAYPFAAMN
ncbi:glycine cleavage system aminomethyltransferase GcvT [Ferrimicrobium acidiphilum]|uniref:glycine cleavage system aminomethyltransferase GcvT n=1 Tax=Ferrimicrobium acidiphilum TaxID=121039 RepID=UPI0023EFA69D|nr:glycine cleavage system aminomethyltransferase GcvT [Ferrimicrobium acidiphilum]